MICTNCIIEQATSRSLLDKVMKLSVENEKLRKENNTLKADIALLKGGWKHLDLTGYAKFKDEAVKDAEAKEALKEIHRLIDTQSQIINSRKAKEKALAEVKRVLSVDNGQVKSVSYQAASDMCVALSRSGVDLGKIKKAVDDATKQKGLKDFDRAIKKIRMAVNPEAEKFKLPEYTKREIEKELDSLFCKLDFNKVDLVDFSKGISRRITTCFLHLKGGQGRDFTFVGQAKLNPNDENFPPLGRLIALKRAIKKAEKVFKVVKLCTK